MGPGHLKALVTKLCTNLIFISFGNILAKAAGASDNYCKTVAAGSNLHKSLDFIYVVYTAILSALSKEWIASV